MDEIKELGAPKEAPEYTPMPDAFAEPEREEKDYGSDLDGLSEAAADLDESRRADADAPITERKYVTIGGENEGKPRPDHETLDIDRAARDLHRQRSLEANAIEQHVDEATAFIADSIRGQQPQQQADAQQPEQLQAQPEAQPTTDEEMLRSALERPAVRQALESQLQTVEAQRAQYAKAAGDSFDLAHAALFINFPELNNAKGGQLQAVLGVLQQRDPARYAAVVSALQATDRLHATATQAKAQEAQIAEARQKMWVVAEEKRFESAVLAKEPRETVEAVSRNGARILSESYGISVDQLKEAFATNPALRSAPMQAALYDLIKTKLVQESLAQKRAPANVPPVMRPGVSRPPSYNDDETSSALKAFKADPNPKSAAAYLSAKRAAARK
jgi:hypothetical protein